MRIIVEIRNRFFHHEELIVYGVFCNTSDRMYPEIYETYEAARYSTMGRN